MPVQHSDRRDSLRSAPSDADVPAARPDRPVLRPSRRPRSARPAGRPAPARSSPSPVGGSAPCRRRCASASASSPSPPAASGSLVGPGRADHRRGATPAPAARRVRAARPLAGVRLRVGDVAGHARRTDRPGVTALHGRRADRRLRRRRCPDGRPARRGRLRRPRARGGTDRPPGRGGAVLARADGPPVPRRRRHGGARLPDDRLHRGLLRRRRHRDQQRALPPPARGRPRPLAHGSTASPTSTRPSCTPSATRSSTSCRCRPCPAPSSPASEALRRGAAALGWRHDEIPRWMDVPGRHRRPRRPPPQHDRDLPAARRRAPAPAC